jgi:hypothetical protein
LKHALNNTAISPSKTVRGFPQINFTASPTSVSLMAKTVFVLWFIEVVGQRLPHFDTTKHTESCPVIFVMLSHGYQQQRTKSGRLEGQQLDEHLVSMKPCIRNIFVF